MQAVMSVNTKSDHAQLPQSEKGYSVRVAVGTQASERCGAEEVSQRPTSFLERFLPILMRCMGAPNV